MQAVVIDPRRASVAETPCPERASGALARRTSPTARHSPLRAHPEENDVLGSAAVRNSRQPAIDLIAPGSVDDEPLDGFRPGSGPNTPVSPPLE